jgi:hypothetical protein
MRKPSTPVVLVLLVLIGFGVTLSAQSPTLVSLQNTLNALVQTVNAIGVAVNAIGATVAPGNTRFTPELWAFYPDHLRCTATNVTSVSRTVTIQMFGSGEVFAEETFGIQPGTSATTVFSPVQSAVGFRVYCKLTVVNGTKADVRGVLAIFTPTVDTFIEKVALAAE